MSKRGCGGARVVRLGAGRLRSSARVCLSEPVDGRGCRGVSLEIIQFSRVDARRTFSEVG